MLAYGPLLGGIRVRNALMLHEYFMNTLTITTLHILANL
jgi:hypothetical protein